MSFFTKLQNIFGFGPDPDDFDELSYGAASSDHTSSGYTTTDTTVHIPAAPNVHDADAPLEASDEMVVRIFDKVVEVTNASMPAYLAKAVDPEKQKKYLYDALDTSVKQYLASLEAAAQDRCMALWQGERDELKKEMEQLKQRAKEIELKKAEINEQKLSSDRQKRALSERVHDLQNTILKLEAEKEQLEIEKSSLLNKAKVANVYESDLESMRQQIEQLKNSPENIAIAKENEQLKATIEALNGELAKANEAFEAAKLKDKMGDTMLNDLQKRNAESVKNANELSAKNKELESTLALRDAQIADLKKDLADKEARIQEDEETLEAVEQIAEQIDKFEEIKNKLDQRVATLKEELKNVKHENDTLRLTIKNNVYAHAQQEKALKDQIDQLRTQ